MILSVHHIEKSFGESRILKDVSFEIEEHERYALVGPNGCGKSTLLTAIVNPGFADGGTVSFGKGVSFGYLAQYQDEHPKGTLQEYVLHAREDILEKEAYLRSLEEKMQGAGEDALSSVMEEYQKENTAFDFMGGYSYRSEVIGVLNGLGFSAEDYEKQLSDLSGGQRTRASLARLLVTSPDLLILDEPINHLDLSSVEWLEGFLQSYRGALLIVAHDRYFLDHVADHIVDLSLPPAHVFCGNFTSYEQQKDLMVRTSLRAAEKQQKEQAHQQEVIDRLKQFNREKSIKRARSRERMLARMQTVTALSGDNASMTLSFSPSALSGKDVLTVQNLSKGFDGNLLFSKVSFDIRRGEHVALIGDNGTGKTTLFKIIRGLLSQDEGEVRLGTGVVCGYYDQAQAGLSDEKTVFDELSDRFPKMTQTQIRNVLAAFLFRGDDVKKTVRSLSGGERGRVALAELMLSGANFLLLDEPTNHLDMDSKGILEDAVNNFEGTVFYVSHDRYFVNKTADRILELYDRTLVPYLGDYDDYLLKRDEMHALVKKDVSPKDAGNCGTSLEKNPDEDDRLDADSGALSWEEQKRIRALKNKKENQLKKIEDEIAVLEKNNQELNEALSDPKIATNSARLKELSRKKGENDSRLSELYDSWEKLCEELA